MGEMLKKHDGRNNQKITKKICMPFAIILKVLFQKGFPLEGVKP
jgi:hypothetical protein